MYVGVDGGVYVGAGGGVYVGAAGAGRAAWVSDWNVEVPQLGQKDVLGFNSAWQFEQ